MVGVNVQLTDAVRLLYVTPVALLALKKHLISIVHNFQFHIHVLKHFQTQQTLFKVL